MITLKIQEREIPLLFNTGVWGDIEENICDLAMLEETLKGKQRVNTVLRLVWLMGNEGLKKAGETPDLTVEWLRDAVHPAKLRECREAVLKAVEKGMRMEDADGKEKDLSLEKALKKEDAGN